MGPGRRIIAGVRLSNLFDVPGKPFGWAHVEERRLIREHLDRKYGRIEPGSWDWAVREMGIVNRIQMRLHRYDLPFREIQALYARQRPAPVGISILFTWEEYERIVEHFAGANDPVTASIAAKAKLALDNRNDIAHDSSD